MRLCRLRAAAFSSGPKHGRGGRRWFAHQRRDQLAAAAVRRAVELFAIGAFSAARAFGASLLGPSFAGTATVDVDHPLHSEVLSSTRPAVAVDVPSA